MTDTIAVTEATEEGRFEFDDAFQKKIVALSLRDTIFATSTHGLVKPEHFVSELDAFLMAIAYEFYQKYRKTPDMALIPTLLKKAFDEKRIRDDFKAEIKGRLREVLTTDISDRGLIADEVSTFAKNQAMERALMSSVDLLQKRDFSRIKKLMDEAMQVGTVEMTEYDYWGEIENRTSHRIDLVAGVIKPNGITSGYAELDKWLQPGLGWGRKELSVIMGAAKAGKSMSLGEFGKNASLAGYNVLYASCEVSTAIIADRCDANVSDTAARLIKDSPHKVKEAVQRASAKAGKFIIQEFPTGTLTPSMLRRMLAHYRGRSINFDLIITDYADIMAPDHRVDEPIENSKSIYIGLRAIAGEENAAVLTATQTNREGAKATTARMTDVAEDFNKVRIADIVISINSTEAERLSGEGRLFFAAVRNGDDGFHLRIKQDREKLKFITKVLGRE
jgi:replicative DNA helicase